MSNPEPIILGTHGTPLHRQVIAFLAQDTDALTGLVPALGAGVESLYPTFLTDGPSASAAVAPRPFLIVYYGGKEAKDKAARTSKVIIEIHDDPDAGDKRWPGLLAHLKALLIGWQPINDSDNRWTSSLHFEREITNLKDDRYNTLLAQLILCIDGMDRTSGKGYQG